jgi:UDP-N-acetylglucosamine 2-epimerase (non-hydrolysing)
LPLRVLVVFGTRPEAIKLGCLVRYLRERPDQFLVSTCVTAQHRLLLDQVLSVFEIVPNYDLDLMRDSQTLHEISTAVLTGLRPVLLSEKPHIVLVQGDTTTTFAAALAAFYAKISVGHVEAGLRTSNKYSPFPEQMNRLLTTDLSDLHFASTEEAKRNLLREGVAPEAITVTGNTVIDSLFFMCRALEKGSIERPRWAFLNSSRKLVLVTAHRRESFGQGIESVCHALRRLAMRSDLQIVFPVHPNPSVREPVRQLLSRTPNVHLIEPLEYTPFVDLLTRADLILTDSGGIQEEAPSLGKPVLVLRENTERPETVAAGSAILVGIDPDRIVAEAVRLLEDPHHYEQMSQHRNLYGDGRACERIADALLEYAAASQAAPQTDIAVSHRSSVAASSQS